MPGEEAASQAWVTLATNDQYSIGALVLAHSLKRSGTTRNIVVMITDGVSPAMQDQLSRAFTKVINVALLDSEDVGHLAMMERPELGVTFTKIQCWKLIQYQTCVFLDADTLVLRNSDELFKREEFSAAPDAGWPDCFNSGVFVFKPSLETYKALIVHAQTEGSFDGGDQGLLNTFFKDWCSKDITKHLSFLYNMCATATYTYLPAYKKYGRDVKIIHFIGASKPWHVAFDPWGTPVPQLYESHTVDHLKRWWTIFATDVKPYLPASLKVLVPVFSEDGIPQKGEITTGAVAMMVGPSGAPVGVPAFSGAAAAASGSGSSHQGRWEEGQPDYLGSASFDNILKKIDATMATSPDPK